jgi:hypothetical protein
LQKCAYQLPYACLSVCPHITSREPVNTFTNAIVVHVAYTEVRNTVSVFYQMATVSQFPPKPRAHVGGRLNGRG